MDLKRKLVFPQDVAVTSLRPDMVLLSRSTKTIIIAELTVLWEERLATSHQLKKAKYQDLVDEAVVKGWHATLHGYNCRPEISKMGRELQKWAEPPKLGRVYSRKDFHHWLWLQPIVIDLHFKIKFIN